MNRRIFLATLGAGAVGCAARTVARPRVPSTRPFEIVDTMPTFFAFWARAEGRPLEDQTARFEAEVIAAHPGVYAPNVLGLRGDDTAAALHARLSRWLPKLPTLVPRMRAFHERFDDDVSNAVERFRGALPDFGWSGTCYLFASIDSMNGGVRTVDGRDALVFGLDVVAGSSHSMPLPVLFAHELFHVHHASVQPRTDGGLHIHDALWTEGLATFASMTLVPSTTDTQALPMSHLHDPAHPSLDIPERRVFLAEAMPTYRKALGGELRAALDSQDETIYAMFFLGRASPALGERPVRSGYWFGLEVVRALARARSLDALSRLSTAALRADIGAALGVLIGERRAPTGA